MRAAEKTYHLSVTPLCPGKNGELPDSIFWRFFCRHR